MIIINFTHNNADHHDNVSIMITLIIIISYSSLLSRLYVIYLYNDSYSSLLICRLSLSTGCPRTKPYNDHSMTIQWTFNEHLVNIQWTFSEYSVEWTFVSYFFSKHSVTIQWPFATVNIQWTFSEHSVTIQKLSKTF